MSDIVRRVLFEHECQRREEDWLDRRQREKREAREREQREREAREAKQQRASNTWATWYAHLDARTLAHIEGHSRDVMCKAVGEFCAQMRAEIRKKFRDKDRELEAKIAQLERRLDALSQGKRERFTFAMRSSRS